MAQQLQNTGILISLAWTEAWSRNAGSWYDPVLEQIGFSHNGSSPVGHAALLLVDKKSLRVEYFDCGRYGPEKDLAYIRHGEEFPEVKIQNRAQLDASKRLVNLALLLEELQSFPHLMALGSLRYASNNINYQACRAQIQKEIEAGPKVYGPFLPQATNCARFVMNALLAGQQKSAWAKLQYFPSPSPGNLVQLNSTGALWELLVLKSLEYLMVPANLTEGRPRIKLRPMLKYIGLANE